jgi:transmembrane sensor
MDRAPLNEEEFRALLRKQQQGLTSPEEEHFLDTFDKALDLRTDVSELMSASDLEYTEEEIYAGIWQKEELITQKRPSWHRWLAIAAVITLALGVLVPPLTKRIGQPTGNEQNITKADKQAEPNNFVQLPDGSTVILAPGSKISYSDTFAKHPERSVFLTGEAYFDVMPDRSKPFVVYTGKVRTMAVGTAFSVRALKSEGSIMVTVTEGKVKVHNEKKILATLIPNQQIVYNTSSEETLKEEVNAFESVEWKDEDLFFDDIALETSAKILEERFGYSIKIPEEKLRQKRFTATFRKQQPFLSILKSISMFNDADFRIDSINRTAEIHSTKTP